jgi:hypothetical protein
VIRIRLHALPQDNADAVVELGKVFEILEDSGDVKPRKNSTSKLRLRYLTLAFLDAEG